MTDENDDDESKLNGDGIRAQLASLSTVYELPTFSRNISDSAYISHLSMTFRSPTRNDESCDVFETYVTALARLNHGAEGNISIAVGRSHEVTAEHLSKIWCIPFNHAVRTLEVTTQLIRQDPDSSLSRNASTNDRAIWYRRISSKFFTDTVFATKKAKSLQGNTCAQVFISDKDFVTVYMMKTESDYINTLKEFAKNVVAPDMLVCNASKTQMK
jgi:hypothetical protein